MHLYLYVERWGFFFLYCYVLLLNKVKENRYERVVAIFHQHMYSDWLRMTS